MLACGVLSQAVGPNGETVEVLLRNDVRCGRNDVASARQTEAEVLRACEAVRVLLSETADYLRETGVMEHELPVRVSEEPTP